MTTAKMGWTLTSTTLTTTASTLQEQYKIFTKNGFGDNNSSKVTSTPAGLNPTWVIRSNLYEQVAAKFYFLIHDLDSRYFSIILSISYNGGSSFMQTL